MIKKEKEIENYLLIGAGEAAFKIIKEIEKSNKNKKSNIRIVGLLDDKYKEKSKELLSFSILGSIKDLKRTVKKYEVTVVLLAIETFSQEFLEKIIDDLDLKKVKLKVIPASRETLQNNTNFAKIRSVKAEDLIGRRFLSMNEQLLQEMLNEEKVLVTGAGGSIGSTICQQLLKYPVKEIVCLCRSEYSLYKLKEKLVEENILNKSISYLIGDIRDQKRMQEIIQSKKIDSIFHAAAHKHVPLMEENPKEAFKNNVDAVLQLLEVAYQEKIKQFVFISTDKAVNPANIMGLSKYLAECLVNYYYQKFNIKTIIVRFGNVIGSRGSVVPLFKKQLKEGGPITVTNINVQRYFMSIFEAVMLVINSLALSNGGETFILDMAEPVNINDLVKRLIKLEGFLKEEITIKYTGLRKGEKINEELFAKNDDLIKTSNSRIYEIKQNNKQDLNLIFNKIMKLRKRIHLINPLNFKKEMQDLIK